MVSQERGIVKEVISAGKARVLVVQSGNCDSCGAKKSCGIFAGDKQRIIEARFAADQDIHEGDSVDIHIASSSRILASVLLFLVPVLAMIAGYWAGFAIFKQEGLGILFSAAALVISFVLIGVCIKKIPFLQKASCHITKS